MPFQIAIDGPVAAGKGTVSRLVAARLGFLYVDTGAMYRVAALIAQEKGLPLDDESAVAELIEQTHIEMRNPRRREQDGRLTTVLVDGQDVSWRIRTEEVAKGASIVAQHPKVRTVLVDKQKEIAKAHDVVMEGRDITYRVLPDAQLKIYLTASDLVRAKRRHLELQIKGVDTTFEQVYQDLLARDQRDTQRETDPLQIVSSAWVLDSSDLSIDQVIDAIVGRVRVMRGDDVRSRVQP